jgi:glycosyltransferase involved in cell wall biosynthesis
MKIVHIIAYFTHFWKYQENYLASEQVKQGHEVHVITSNLNYPHPNYKATAQRVMGERHKPIQTLITDGYSVHHLPVWFEISARTLFRGAMEKVYQLNPDLIICHGITQPVVLQLMYQKKWKGTLIVDEHVLLSDVEKSVFKKTALRLYGWLFHKKITERFKKIVAISNGVNLLFTQVLRFPMQNITMIPLGTDTDEYCPDVISGINFRLKNKIPEDAVVIGYTGKIGEYKKVHFLIDAANELVRNDLHILIVGDVTDSYSDFLHQKIISSKVPVTKLSSVPSAELPQVYNACDILAWPAHQTISTVNASACGKPVICSNFLKERYSKGQGIGIISGDYDDFRNALHKLIEDKELRITMGRLGRDWAVNEVSWRIINERFIS